MSEFIISEDVRAALLQDKSGHVLGRRDEPDAEPGLAQYIFGHEPSWREPDEERPSAQFIFGRGWDKPDADPVGDIRAALEGLLMSSNTANTGAAKGAAKGPVPPVEDVVRTKQFDPVAAKRKKREREFRERIDGVDLDLARVNPKPKFRRVR